MASVQPASHHRFLLLLCFVVSASVAQKNISATVGDSVTLPCKAPNNSIRVMWWSKSDQEPKHVFMYRDQQFDAEEQHPSFINRVDLQDRRMKDGDVSLRLTNVMISDSGTYVCYVFMEGPKQRKRTADSISVINLSVSPGPIIITVKPDKCRASTGETSCRRRLSLCYLLLTGFLLIGLGEYLIYREICKVWVVVQDLMRLHGQYDELCRAVETQTQYLLELNRQLDASLEVHKPAAAVHAGEMD